MGVRREETLPLLAAAASVVSALVSAWLLRHVALAPAARLVTALAPAPFFLWFLLAELRWVRGLDEFHRKVILDSLAIAFPAGILLAVVVEGLQKAGFVTGWGIGDVWPYMALLWLPSMWVSYRRYAVPEE